MKRTEEYLCNFLSGELEKIIDRYKKRLERKWPEEYYCTINSVSYIDTRSDTNNIGDPTGGRATHLANIEFNTREDYNLHLEIYNIIKQVLSGLDSWDIEVMKVQYGATEKSFNKIAKEYGVSYGKARRRAYKLQKEIETEIVRYKVFDETTECTESRYSDFIA